MGLARLVGFFQRRQAIAYAVGLFRQIDPVAIDNAERCGARRLAEHRRVLRVAPVVFGHRLHYMPGHRTGIRAHHLHIHRRVAEDVALHRHLQPRNRAGHQLERVALPLEPDRHVAFHPRRQRQARRRLLQQLQARRHAQRARVTADFHPRCIAGPLVPCVNARAAKSRRPALGLVVQQVQRHVLALEEPEARFPVHPRQVVRLLHTARRAGIPGRMQHQLRADVLAKVRHQVAAIARALVAVQVQRHPAHRAGVLLPECPAQELNQVLG